MLLSGPVFDVTHFCAVGKAQGRVESRRDWQCQQTADFHPSIITCIGLFTWLGLESPCRWAWERRVGSKFTESVSTVREKTHVKIESKSIALPLSQCEAQLPASTIPSLFLYNISSETRDSAPVSCMMNSCVSLSSPLLNETGWWGMPLSPQPLEVGHREYYHGSKCAYGCVWGMFQEVHEYNQTRG